MKITAAELIKELQSVPGDTEVRFEMNDGCCGDFMDLELAFAEAEVLDKGTKDERGSCQIRVNAIDGHKNCRQSSATKDYIKRLYP